MEFRCLFLRLLPFGVLLLAFFFLLCYRKDKSSYFFICQVITFCLFLSVAVAFYYRVKVGLPVNLRTILSFVNPRFMNQVHVWLIIPLAYLALLHKLRSRPSLIYTTLLSLSLSLIFTLDIYFHY